MLPPSLPPQPPAVPQPLLPPPLLPPPTPPTAPPGNDHGVELRGQEFLIVGASIAALLLATAAWCLYRRRCRKRPAPSDGSQKALSGKSGGTQSAFAERQAAAGRTLLQEKAFMDPLPPPSRAHSTRAEPCRTGSTSLASFAKQNADATPPWLVASRAFHSGEPRNGDGGGFGMVALGRGTESRAAERARESLGKRAAGAAAAAARQLESLSPTKLGARLSLTASPTKHRASLSGYPSLAASPTKVGESIGERLPPTKHRTRSSHAKPESRQPGGVLSPTRHERSRRVRTAKGRSTDVEAVEEPEELGGHAAALRGRLAARQASLDVLDC